ncbi:MAG TPA: acyltransferase [Terriglobales bacterium]
MSRIPQLDGLRASAISMVFCTHALHVPLLWMGVDLFFVLSGYLITRILLGLKQNRDDGYWQPFYARRVLRILPPLAGFLIAASFMSAIPWARIWYWYAFFGANVAQSFGMSHVASLSPLWSLGVEEQFYLIWPVIVLFCSTKRLKAIALTIVFVSPCLRAVATPLFSNHFPIYYLTIFRADTICMGAFVAASETLDSEWVLWHRQSALRFSGCALIVFVTLSFLSNFRTSANSVLFNSLGYSMSTIFFGGVLVYVLGRRAGVDIKILTFGPVRYLGRISYTFYLWHVAVLVELGRFFHSQTATAMVGFVLTTALAAISWQFVERPLLHRGAQFRSKQPRELAAAA